MAVNDLKVAQLQTTGMCNITGMSITDVVDTIDALGLDFNRSFITKDGNLVIADKDAPIPGDILLDQYNNVLVKFVHQMDENNLLVRTDSGEQYSRGKNYFRKYDSLKSNE